MGHKLHWRDTMLATARKKAARIQGNLRWIQERASATKQLLKIASWIYVASWRMLRVTLKPIRTPDDLGRLDEANYWFQHEAEEISSIVQEEPDTTCFGEAAMTLLFRYGWRACNLVAKRADAIYAEKLRDSDLILAAEREIRKMHPSGDTEYVIFEMRHKPSCPNLSILTDRTNSEEWNIERSYGLWIVRAKKYVHQELSLEQEAELPEYLHVGPAYREPEGEAAELFKALYFGGKMGFKDAYDASLALTT